MFPKTYAAHTPASNSKPKSAKRASCQQMPEHGEAVARDTYRYIELATGRSVPISDASSAPWDVSRADNTFPLRPGFAVVMHSMFCGKDHGLTFTVHPNDATKMLPSGNELTEHEKTVLTATKSYKASYAGMDRYQMAQSEDYRFAKPFPTRPEWQLAKESLITKKLLNKAGAITIDGRNAIAR